MGQFLKRGQLQSMPSSSVSIMNQNLPASIIGAGDGLLQNLPGRDKKSSAIRRAVQRPNCLPRSYGRSNVQHMRMVQERRRDTYALHNTGIEYEKPVVRSTAKDRIEATWSHAAGHPACFHELVDPADVVRNLRCMSPTATCA